MNLVGTGRPSETRFKLRDKNRVRTKRLDLIREGLIQTLNKRHHHDHGQHADTDSENRQRRAQLVRAQRVECHQCRFFYVRSEEHTSELQSQSNLVCRLLLEKKKKKT